MATYKVIQDIEAEDKLLGPLTLRQFIYAGIALTCAYLSFMAVTRGLAFLTAFLLPPILIFGFLAWPFGRDQPTEVWVLAKLRFMLKPRRRIWDQSGMKELVTITAPKRDDKVYTDGLSQGEVKSRLQALANTLDSRGWAVKNVNVNLFTQPQYATATVTDRLIDPGMLPREVANDDITSSDDIMDELNNPTAQHLEQMISASTSSHRQQIMDRMKQSVGQPAGQTTDDNWFLGQSPSGSSSTTGTTGIDEHVLATQLRASASRAKKTAAYGHMKVIDPLGSPSPSAAHPMTPPVNDKVQPTSPPAPDPAILELANNDDLNVATIARQAHKKRGPEPPDDEVVIPLR